MSHQKKSKPTPQTKLHLAKESSFAFCVKLLVWLKDLPGITKCISTLDPKEEVPNFEIENTEPIWFGHVISFLYNGQPYRIFLAFQYNENAKIVYDLFKDKPTDFDSESNNLYRSVTSMWIQVNEGKSYELHHGESFFRFRVDSAPHHDQVERYPLHIHRYENNKGLKAQKFNGSLDDFLEFLSTIIY